MNLKFVDESETELEGLLLPFGGPFQGRDFAHEAFTKSTDFCLDWFPEGTTRPLLYHHGLAEGTGVTPVGYIKSVEMREDGGWMRAQLDASNKYCEAVKKLLKEKALFLSSGTMKHLVESDSRTGQVKRWPVVEGSLTPTPCNPFAVVDFATVKSHYKSADIDIDALKAHMGEAEENNHTHDPITTVDYGDVAIKTLSYETLLENLRSLVNPISPYADATYSTIVATYPDHIIVSRFEQDAEVKDIDQTFWRIDYALDDAGVPALGKATNLIDMPQEQVVPASKSLQFDGPLTLDAQALTRHAESITARTKDVTDRRIAEGRTLSAPNRRELLAATKSLQAASVAIQGMLDTSDELYRAKAKADALASPQSLLAGLDLLKLFESTI